MPAHHQGLARARCDRQLDWPHVRQRRQGRCIPERARGLCRQGRACRQPSRPRRLDEQRVCRLDRRRA
eukprot:10869228-Alexandrium_andersonii.AAC.1